MPHNSLLFYFLEYSIDFEDKIENDAPIDSDKENQKHIFEKHFYIWTFFYHEL